MEWTLATCYLPLDKRGRLPFNGHHISNKESSRRKMASVHCNLDWPSPYPGLSSVFPLPKGVQSTSEKSRISDPDFSRSLKSQSPFCIRFIRGRTFGRWNIGRLHLGHEKLGDNVKTEDWAKDPEIRRRPRKLGEGA